MLKDILPFPELNSQFGKLTDRTEGAPVPEPAEGALSKSYIYTVAKASGSELCVFLLWLFFCLFPCNSVANFLLLLSLPSVKFRVRPWLCLCSLFIPWLSCSPKESN